MDVKVQEIELMVEEKGDIEVRGGVVCGMGTCSGIGCGLACPVNGGSGCGFGC